jgi:hypothetical protein
MAKLQKHAEVLSQLHSMVKKQAAEAQKSVTGAPGDVKSKSVSDEHEHTDKNSVGPENVAQSYSQKPSDDPSEPLAKSKTATDLGAEILDIIRKQAEAQDSVTGAPGDVTSESVDDKHEKIDKNSVKPESNSQNYKQKGSTDSSKPLANAKKADVSDLAAKIASYNLGREFCAALLKTAGLQNAPQENELHLLKQAGRRDCDAMIAQAAEALENHSQQQVKQAELQGAYDCDAVLNQYNQVKQAQLQGAVDCDNLIKSASLQLISSENEQLKAKVAEYESLIKQAQDEYQVEAYSQMAQEQQQKLAQEVATTVLNQLKSEVA